MLGLRYIHKEKFIVHRDLTPNNIMLGENDKVTISKTSALDSVLFVVVALSIPQEVYNWFRSVFCS